MSTIRVVNLQHTDATEPNIVLESDGTALFASGITISGGTNLTVSGVAEFASGTVSAPTITFIDDNNTGIYEPAADTVAITTAATERLRVDNSGNVGIGVTNVVQTLDIGSSGYAGLGFKSNRTTAADNIGGPVWRNNSDQEKAFIQCTVDGQLKFGAGGATERMRIDSSGRVGIGTTSPGSTLELSSAATSAAAGATITNTNAAGYSTLQFKNTGTSGRTYTLALGGSTSAFPGSVYLYDDTAGTSRVLVDSSGRVGIGNTSPSTLGTGRVVIGDGSGSETLTIFSSASTNGNIHFADGTTSSDRYRGYISYLHTDNSMSFGTNDIEQVRILSTGGLTFNGDTAQANALNDYERGTFTPLLAYHQGNTQLSTLSPVSTLYKGRYTKIGDRVYFDLYVRYNLSGGTPNNTDQIRITLPFAAGSNGQQYTAAYVGYLSNFYAAPTSSDSNHYFPGAYVHDNRSEVVLTVNRMDGGTNEQMPTMSTNTSGGIMVAGSYTVINS